MLIRLTELDSAAARSSASTFSSIVGIRNASSAVFTISRSASLSVASRTLSSSSACAPSSVFGKSPMYV